MCYACACHFDNFHALADHLIKAAESGYGKTQKQVKAIVENVARENSRPWISC